MQSTPVAIYNCPSRRGPTLFVNNDQFGAAYLMDYAGVQPATRPTALPDETRFYDPGKDGNKIAQNNSAFWSFGYPNPQADAVYDGVIVRTPWRRTNMPPPDSGPAEGSYLNNVPRPTSFAKVTDGTSKTMMIGEKWVFVDNYPGVLNENGQPADPSDDHGWCDGWDPDTMRSTFHLPLPDSQPDGLDGQNYWFGSAHSGAFNAVFADGSVRSVSYDIDPYIFNSLGTRNGTALNESSSTEGVN